MKKRTFGNRLKTWGIRYLVAACVTVPLTLLALWMTLEHIPSWYRPVQLDGEGIHRAKVDATSMADWVSENMVEGEPFEIILHDQSLNEWLAALPHSWPDAWRSVPPEISEPAVRFDDEELRIGAHCSLEGWEVIVSLGLELGISENGDFVTVALAGVRGGSLPFPRSMLTGSLEPLLEEVRSSHNRGTSFAAPVVQALRDAPSVEALFDGLRIPNRFTWPNGNRRFRIDSISIADGELRLAVSPE